MLLLRNMNETLSALRNGDIATTDGNDQFILKDEKVWCYSRGNRFSLDIPDFVELYQKNRFFLYEEPAGIDESKDEAYYRYYKK